MSEQTVRRASKAGSWYAAERVVLESQIRSFIAEAKRDDDLLDENLNKKFDNNINNSTMSGSKISGQWPSGRSIVVPHAGYRFSGFTAGSSYRSLLEYLIHNPLGKKIKRIFILGPSHHVYIDGCALSTFTHYGTPLGKLPIDRKIVKELMSKSFSNDRSKKINFLEMSHDMDEDEHSIEMQLPFLRYILNLVEKIRKELNDKDYNFKPISIVPIMVGSIKGKSEKEFGNILKEYVNSDENGFVISTDFCHWGTRFDYTSFTRYPNCEEIIKLNVKNIKFILNTGNNIQNILEKVDIYKSIKYIDCQGMRLLSLGDHDKWLKYLKDTGNTICGRHPLGIMLCALSKDKNEDKNLESNETQKSVARFKWLHYEQSSTVRYLSESSVSYVAGYVE